MNSTSDPIVLLPRTKLGVFTLINPDRVDIFDTGEVNNVDLVNSSCSRNTFDDPHVKEVLSKVKLNSEHLTIEQESSLKNLLANYGRCFSSSGWPSRSLYGE